MNKSQRIMNALHFASMVVVPLLFAPYAGRLHSTDTKIAGLIVLLVLALLTLIFRYQELDKSTWFTLENVFLLIYTLFLIASVFVAKYPATALFGSSTRMDGVLSFFLYMNAYFLARQAKGTSKVLFKWMVVSGLLISIVGILQFFQVDPKWLRLYGSSFYGLSFSTMGNPNFLGTWLVLLIPIALYVYVYQKGWYAVLIYGVLFFNLLATHTRGSWIGAFFAVMFFMIGSLVYQKNKVKLLKKYAVVVLVTGFSFTSFVYSSHYDFGDRFWSIFTGLQDVIEGNEDAKYAGSFRFYVWKKVGILIMERPLLGWGVENMTYAMSDHFYHEIEEDFGVFKNWDKAHNEFLNIAVSSGIPSLMVYLGFLFLIFKKGIKKIKYSAVHFALLASLLGYLIQAQFNLQVAHVFYVWMGFLGLFSSDRHLSVEQKQKLEDKVIVEP